MGNAKSFTCPYHGWVYDSAGRLIAVPSEEVYNGRLDKADWGAIVVPRLESYRGLFFGNWNPAAPLVEDMGDLAWYMDALFDRTPNGMEVIGGVYKWVINCNWKYPAEQFTQDAYHVATTHLAGISSTLPPGAPLPPIFTGPVTKAYAGNGHGLGFTTDMPPDFRLGVMAAGSTRGQYLVEQSGVMTERLGEVRANMAAFHLALFPNFAFLPGVQSIRVWHPRGPGKTEIWSWAIVDKNAPAEAKEEWRKGVITTFSPGGVFEQDDADNWQEMQRVLNGYVATWPAKRRSIFSKA
jgi:phenylpropionate dioxygenase-like ring-hydroxylating dioxygenase large terminal subunit